jgi:hypothetical protein
MQAKDQRVMQLATEIVELMRKHTPRHEAVDAVDVAKVLFRPELGLTIHDQEAASKSLQADFESVQAAG